MLPTRTLCTNYATWGVTLANAPHALPTRHARHARSACKPQAATDLCALVAR